VVASALEKLKNHPEPEAHFMRTGDGKGQSGLSYSRPTML
jgi:hypothetical protein